MTKKVLLSVGFILLIGFVLFLSSFNLFIYLNAENKVTNIFAMDELRKEAFGEDTDITNVKYLGNHIFHVETEDGIYKVEIVEKRYTYHTCI